MQIQEYILENQESFCVKHIFECGQCFRWNLQKDGSYIGVIKQGVVQAKQEGKRVVFKGKCEGDIEKVLSDYFGLEINYNQIKDKLAQIDDFMRESIRFGRGIRLLHQDFWECIISFIISANNNIPRIKKMIERMAEKYGTKVEFMGKDYFLFPTPEQLAGASVEDLRRLGFGFRDKRVYETTKKVVNQEFDLEKVSLLTNSNEIREELLKLDGVGPKVADCIMLFSLQRFEVFPVDVWIRRVMNELYIHKEEEQKVSQKMLIELAEEKFQKLAGIAQQYLYYWERNGNYEKVE